MGGGAQGDGRVTCVREQQCHSTEAVWLQSQEGESSEKMVLTFICLGCHAHWIG